jgi:uncharacterized membrane protein
LPGALSLVTLWMVAKHGSTFLFILTLLTIIIYSHLFFLMFSLMFSGESTPLYEELAV